MPVWSAGMMSVAANATGWKPFAFHICTAWSSPAQQKILSFFSSSTVFTGVRVKKCTHPPCPQLRSTKPFAASRASSAGRIRSSTWNSSG